MGRLKLVIRVEGFDVPQMPIEVECALPHQRLRELHTRGAVRMVDEDVGPILGLFLRAGMCVID
jgi:hypothetical protein